MRPWVRPAQPTSCYCHIQAGSSVQGTHGVRSTVNRAHDDEHVATKFEISMVALCERFLPTARPMAETEGTPDCPSSIATRLCPQNAVWCCLAHRRLILHTSVKYPMSPKTEVGATVFLNATLHHFPSFRVRCVALASGQSQVPLTLETMQQ